MKRIISVLLTLCMVVSMFAGVDLTAFAADNESTYGQGNSRSVTDYSGLTANQYLSMIITNNNYSGSLNQYGTVTDYPPYALMDNYLLNPEETSKARIIFNEFNGAYDYETTRGLYELLTFNPSSLANDVMKLEDYYTAILLSLLEANLCSDNYIDNLNCEANKTFLYLSKSVFDLLKVSASAENIDLDKIYIYDLTPEQMSQICELSINNSYSKDLWSKVGKNTGRISNILYACSTLNDAVKNICAYATIAKVSADVEAVLLEMYNNCPDDNQPMKTAIRKVYDYVSDKMSTEILSMIELGEAGFNVGYKILVSKFWSSALTAVLGELAVGVLIGQAVGKAIANFCFATDAVDEQLCAISALVDFEDVMVDTVKSLRSKYLEDSSAENSDNLMKSIYLLNATYDLGTDYVEDFVETVYEKGFINNVIFDDSEELANWKRLIANQKSINEQRKRFFLLETYKDFYKVDAPSAYEKYFGTNNGDSGSEEEEIPVTGISAEQIKDIYVGYEGPVYNYFKIALLPSNETNISIGGSVISSDDSVIEVDDSGLYIGGCIKAVGSGTCTLTFSTYDNKHSTSVEVTVLAGSSSDPEYDYFSNFEYTVNLDNETATITGYSGNAEYLAIPSKIDGYVVTKIGNSAFRECTSLTSITIPDSVTSIGGYAFEYCVNLTSAKIPNSVTSIGDFAFGDCRSLISVTIPNGVINIDRYTFYNCSCLTSVIIPDSVTSIGTHAFYGCSSLTSITIPKNVTNIDEFAFKNCINLKTVNNYSQLPVTYEGVISCGMLGYYSDTINWYAVLTGDCGDGLNYTFYAESGLLRIYGTGAMTSYSFLNGTYTTAPWSNYRNFIKTIEISNGVTSIGDCAFNACENLTAVTIPNGVESIGSEAFRYCDSLTAITIPDSVTSIDEGAFSSCKNLKNVNNYSKLPIIKGSAYYGYAGYYADTVNWYAILTGVCGNNLKYTFYAETGLLKIEGSGAIANSVPWSEYRTCIKAVEMSDDVTSMGRSFKYCNSLTSITVPKSVKSIDFEEFYGCSSLVSIVIPEGVTSIGSYAFRDCSSLTSIDIPEGVISIGAAAFWDCSSLTCIKIPSSVTNIGEAAFSECISLSSIDIPEGVTSIGSRAFSNCSSLTSIIIPSSVTSIGINVFGDCNNLESIFVKTDNTVYHSDNNCLIETESKTIVAGLKNSVIPSDGSVMYIGNSAFANCNDLSSITIPNCIISIEDDAFMDCPNLSSVTISDGVTEIGNNAFRYCCGLTAIVIPYSVTNIGRYAFAMCSNLTSITIPENVKLIGDHAFYDCNNLILNVKPGSYAMNYSIKNEISYVFDGEITSIFVSTIPVRTVYPISGKLNTEGLKITANLDNGTTCDITSACSIGECDMSTAGEKIVMVTYGDFNCTFEITVDADLIEYPESIHPYTNNSDLSWNIDNHNAKRIAITFSGETYTEKSYDYIYIYDGEDNLIGKYSGNELSSERIVVHSNTVKIRLTSDYSNTYYGFALIDVEFYYEDCTHINTELRNQKNADCVNSGYTGDTYCIDCDTMLSSGEDTPELGHTEVLVETVSPTCTERGFDVYKCSVCEDEWQENWTETVAHQYENEVCSTCGVAEKLKYYIATWGDGEHEGEKFACIEGISEDVTDLVIPEYIEGYPVQTINYGAFSGNTKIRTVSFPSTLTRIDGGAFNGCTGLEEVHITDLAAWCSVDCSDSFTNPLRYADELYLNGELLTDLVIPEGVEAIGTEIFAHYNKLHSVTVPSSVKRMGSNAFGSCEGLTDVYISDIAAWCNIEFASSSSNPLLYADNLYLNGELVTEIIIPEGVTGISSYAFSSDCITNITIPDSVTSIGNYAFYYCESLTSINIPDSVTSIGDCTFEECSSLKSITIPDGITSIGNRAFYWCTSLTSITIPDGVTSIGDRAFYWCTGMTIITIPNSVTSIGDYAFYECDDLWHVLYTGNEEEWNNISINASGNSYVTDVIRHYNCTNGSVSYSVVEEPSCSKNGKGVYSCSLCDEQKKVSIGGLDHIGEYISTVAPKCSANGYDIYLCSVCGHTYNTNYVNSLGHEYEATSVIAPSCVEDGYTEYKCSRCEYTYTSDYVDSLGHNFVDGVCSNCNSSENECIESEHNYANNCDETWTLQKEGAKFIAVTFSNKTYVEYYSDYIYIYDGEDNEIGVYTGNELAGKRKVIHSDTVKIRLVSDEAYSYYGFALTKVETYYEDCTHINTEIRDYVAVGCVNDGYTGDTYCVDCEVLLSSGEYVTQWGHMGDFIATILPTCTDRGYDLYICSVCDTEYKENWTETTNHQYENGFCAECGKLEGLLYETNYNGIRITGYEGEPTHIVIPDTIEDVAVTSIAMYAFYGCTSLESIIIPESVASIENSAFSGCTNLKSVTINGNVTRVESETFCNCVNLSSINMPDTVTFVGSRAFKNCKSLTSISLKGVTSISDQAFYNCESLAEIEFSDKLEYIGGFSHGAFENCKSLTSVALPASLQTISEYAFKGCTNLSDVKISENTQLQYIGRDAFTDTPFINDESNYINGFLMLGNILLKVSKDFSGVCYLPDGITYVLEDSFEDCNKVTIVVIPEGVTEIEYMAFEYCGNIAAIYLPSTITHIDYWNFSSCSNLFHVMYAGTEEQWSSIQIGDSGNSYLLNAVKHYNVTENCVSYTVAKEASCTEYGSATVVCSICSEEKVISLSKKVHDGIYVSTTLPTCYDWGYDVYKCDTCGQNYNTNYVNLLGHEYEVTSVVSPTCREGGYTEYKCTRCEYTYISDYVDAIGHSFADGVCINCNRAEEDCIESEHDYPNNCDETWTISKPGAEYITITFSADTRTESGYDFIYIYDKDDNQIGCYSGTQLASKEIKVDGDTVKIRLTSDGSYTYYGFSLDDVSVYVKQTLDSVEIVMPEESIDSETIFCVDEVDINEITSSQDEFDYENIVVYDLYFDKDGERVQPEDEVVVYIPVPENMNGARCKVIYINDLNEITDMNAVHENGFMKFTTGHFSYYAVVEEADISVSGVVLDKETLSLVIGESDTLIVTVTPGIAINKTVVWNSSDTSIATVDDNGKITALKKGTVTITATTEEGGFVASCEVNVICVHQVTTTHPANDSTCLVQGNNEYTTCDTCGTVVSGSDAKLPFAEHKGGTATCTEKAICVVCNEPYGDYSSHNLTNTPEVEATHDNAGNIEYWTCGICNKYFTDANGANEITQANTVINKIPHSYSNDWSKNDTQHWHECNCGDKTDVANHTFDNACDTECNVCKAVRKAEPHKYDNACDTDCNICQAVREVDPHKYDNACDTDCNICQAVREVDPHKYDNACDTDCNICQAVREVDPHKYDNACDTDCNTCKAVREVEPHKYDNACDADCNICKVVREVVPHKYDNACDTDCNICKAVREVEPHVYDDEYDVDCNNCNAIREVEIAIGILGDVNGDGKVNVKDATLIQKAAASLVTLDETANACADVNGDGKVNVKDATAIQKYAASLETGFAIGDEIKTKVA